MNQQRTNWQITTPHLMIWLCVGFLAGMVPIFGPILLGILMLMVGARMKFHPDVQYSPLLAILSATIGQYAAGYLMSGFHIVALAQIAIFLLACVGTWCYRWCRNWWKERKTAK